MNKTLVDKIADAVLYEGYILYPYRASSQKNRERFTFGRVYPRDYSIDQHGAEPWMMQAQCLVRLLDKDPDVTVRARFLQPMKRDVGAAPLNGDFGDVAFNVLPSLEVEGQRFQTWHEAVEREIAIPPMALLETGETSFGFTFPKTQSIETIRSRDGAVAGLIRRWNEAIIGDVKIEIELVDLRVFRVSVRVTNMTPMDALILLDPDSLLMRIFASTHFILDVTGAEFLSNIDPPSKYAEASETCANVGVWPVLVGDERKGDKDTMLASPIILYDYPQIAPESAGDFCDGTEIDEMLTLRVLTMTDEEKREMRGVDTYARRILERTESMDDDRLLNLHGALREMEIPGKEDFFDENKRVDQVCVRDVMLMAGDRVLIRPRNRADAIDMILDGKIGVIEAIEQDAEDRVHFALVLEDDPGRDLGMARQPGHRFFYTSEEVEPIPREESCAS